MLDLLLLLDASYASVNTVPAEDIAVDSPPPILLWRDCRRATSDTLRLGLVLLKSSLGRRDLLGSPGTVAEARGMVYEIEEFLLCGIWSGEVIPSTDRSDARGVLKIKPKIDQNLIIIIFLASTYCILLTPFSLVFQLARIRSCSEMSYIQGWWEMALNEFESFEPFYRKFTASFGIPA